jgi:hypothetical protein
MRTVFVRCYLGATAHPTARQFFAQNLPGDNLGNLLFTYAVERQLSASTATVLAEPTRGRGMDPHWLQENVDQLVIPLANAFRWSFRDRLDALSGLIEQVDLPVTVIGVGAQAAADGTWNPKTSAETDASVRRFVAAVLERGPSIGVRGHFTRDYLLGLGFPDDAVRIIGCPSMFLRGRDLALRVAPELTAEARVAINLSPYVAAMGPVIQHHLTRYPGLDYVAQDVHSLGLLLGEEYGGKGAGDPLLPTHADHPLIAQGRAWMALSSPTWLAELARYDVSLGTRIHGNIAALLAGTPAFVLAHDSRTLELARYHEIPHRLIGSLPDPAAADVARLVAEADFSPTVANHGERFRRYVDYLDEHRLAHIFAPGESGDAFDAAVAAVAYPPVVRAGQAVPAEPVPTEAAPRRRLLDRLRRR